MNYVATSQRVNPAAMIGALGVPAGFGALLVVGLAVTGALPIIPENPGGYIIEDVPLPPPPPQPERTEDPINSQSSTRSVVDTPETPFDVSNGPIFVIEELPPLDEGLAFTPGPVEIGNGGLGIELPAPPLPDPIAASPRNAPGGWITDRDYKTRWIREGREGVAKFRLDVSASGRVSNCEVVGSTGHNVLDLATCRLISKRARFEPARDSSGAKVSGTFTSSVNWQIPE